VAIINIVFSINGLWIVHRPMDIDMIYAFGYGFSEIRGASNV